ncbi:MAG: 1-deoxy-D-xylulose-5-phosphate reductoisomerase [Proteobacteria bacterium]|jgi:1-deoxy-D-xylulose-5-phosphate reductoisomerase|nr:1-deoxy-D-xylulose-5-phosphate reductoisomerase [Pseudomonadota bacterium]
MKRRVVILGATGSIGESAMRVARALPERIEIVGLSGRNNTGRLLELACEFPKAAVCAGDEAAANQLSHDLGRPVLHCEEGLLTLAALPEADLVLMAIVGTTGLKPALHALENEKDLAVASKEILVMAGELVMATAAKMGVRVLPVDSEHNAIFQCLEGQDPSTVKRLILTCSGGPFRKAGAADLASVTPEQALRHPTWSMGRKISVDSATLFNKGLEMIEAKWLFGMPMEQVDVIVHPQSIVHSMVEFLDGSILAQLGSTDMALPIQYALTYPERLTSPCAPLDLTALGKLEFEVPRTDLFPALDLARRAGTAGGTLPAVLNASNEAAVDAFLAGRLSFPGIWESVARAMDEVPFVEHPTLDQLIEADTAARKCL